MLEMVIVVVIIGVIAAIAIPRIGRLHARAYLNTAQRLEKELENGLAVYVAEHKEFPSDFTDYVAQKPEPGDAYFVNVTSLRRQLADPKADVFVDSKTIRLKFKNGLVAKYTIDSEGNISGEYSRAAGAAAGGADPINVGP